MTEIRDNTTTEKKRRRGGILALKICGIILGAIVVLAIAAAIGIYCYFTPQRILKIAEEKCSEYLDADVKIGALDYKIFSTYPWLEFEVDSVRVVSRSLQNLSPAQRDSLPKNADFLASVEKARGKINIHALFHDEIELRDIAIDRPDVNIVIVDDSINNFSIIPKEKEEQQRRKMKLPEISLSEIEIGAPVKFSFFSLPDRLAMKAEAESMHLTDKSSEGDIQNFDINLKATLEGSYGNISTPQPIPIELDAGIAMKDSTIEADIRRFATSLEELSLVASTSFSAGKQLISVDQAAIQLNISDVFALLDIVPEEYAAKIPLPAGLDGNIPMRLSASLLQPFSIETSKIKEKNPELEIPAFIADVKIENGDITFAPKGAAPLSANDVAVDAECRFDPANPDDSYFKLSELKLFGEGVELRAAVTIEKLLSQNQPMEGSVKFNSALMQTLSYLLPNSGIKLSGHLAGDVEFSGIADNMGKDGLEKIDIKGNIRSKKLTLASGKGVPGVNMEGLALNYDATLPKYPDPNYQGAKIKLDIKAGALSTGVKNKNLTQVKNIDLKLNVDDTVNGGKSPEGNLTLTLGSISTQNQGTEVSADGVKISAKGHLLNSPPASPREFSLPQSGNEKIIAARDAHTPLYLENQNGGMFQTILSMVSLDADLFLNSANVKIPQYLYPFRLTGMGLTTNLNHIDVTASDVIIGHTTFSFGARLYGIGDYLTAYYPTLLKADADINFTNVDINQLSWGYYGALIEQGHDSVFYIPPLKPFTKADSLCVAIPRNIDANIRLHSASAQYMGYTFAPLHTDILVKDGDATLKNLSIATPYAGVSVDWTYSTRRLDSIYMNLNAKVKDFNFERFYAAFPTLLEGKEAEIKNFTGDVAADVNCHFLMYPSMFMNPASLSAKFDVNAWNLQFERKGRIEKLTHLMLIRGDEPIHLENLNITGAFHDNIFQLNPFKINFDDYQLGIGGVMNMQQRIYFHFALDKSPFHLPFGVNLEGHMKHPEIRVGGTSFDSAKALPVTEENEWNPDVNIMASLRQGWSMFIMEAAKYQQKTNGK